MSEVSRLVVKAIRSLPQDEQDRILEALLEEKLVPDPAGIRMSSPEVPAAGTLVQRFFSQHPGLELGHPPLGPETGGPWQSVPVRLSTEQHERLKQWCQANGFTMAVVLRGLVARFLDDQATRRPRTPPPTDGGAEPSVG